MLLVIDEFDDHDECEVPAHQDCPGQNPKSRNMIRYVLRP